MRASRLKVLVLADSRSFHIKRYLTQLRRQGMRVLLASLERGPVHHYHLKRRGWFRFLNYPLTSPELSAVVRQFRPDVVNCHFVSGYGFAAALAGLSSIAPVVAHVWGSDVLIVPHKSVFHRRKTGFALAHADCVITDSDYVLGAAKKLSRISDGRVIFWGIEKKYLHYHKESYELNTPLKIIVPRTHEPIYDNRFVLDTLAPLANEGLVEVTFPAFGSLVDHFRRRADRIAERGIHYYDCLPRSDFLDFMATFDVYLSSARSDSSPASLIEAMALGLIPIAPDIPGVRQLLTDKSGYRYNLDDPESLVSIVHKIAEESDDHEDMRRSNLETVRREAIFEDNIAQTAEIMRKLVEARQI